MSATWNRADQERERIRRLRGWILRFLYKARPRPVELVVLIRLLDRVNHPVGRATLAEELDYLRGLNLLRIFPLDSNKEHDDVEQSKMIQRYMLCDSDEEMGSVLAARISAAGVNFCEGQDVTGVERVE